MFALLAAMRLPLANNARGLFRLSADFGQPVGLKLDRR
jgi:hypothetical protein